MQTSKTSDLNWKNVATNNLTGMGIKWGEAARLTTERKELYSVLSNASMTLDERLIGVQWHAKTYRSKFVTVCHGGANCMTR